MQPNVLEIRIRDTTAQSSGQAAGTQSDGGAGKPPIPPKAPAAGGPQPDDPGKGILDERKGMLDVIGMVAGRGVAVVVDQLMNLFGNRTPETPKPPEQPPAPKQPAQPPPLPPRQEKPAPQQDIRHNPDLDEAFGMAPQPQPMPAKPKATPPPLPGKAGMPAAPTPPPLPGVTPAAGGGAMAGMAAAAGPIAAVAAGAHILTERFRSVNQSAQELSDRFRGMVNNDLPQLSSIGDTIASKYESIPIVGELYAEQVRALWAPIRMFEDAASALLARSKQIGSYSAEITNSSTQQEVARMMMDMREAQELGPGMSKMIDAQTKLEQSYRELTLPIKKWVTENWQR